MSIYGKNGEEQSHPHRIFYGRKQSETKKGQCRTISKNEISALLRFLL